MRIFYSDFHKLYVAQQTDREGFLCTGRGTTFADAIGRCLNVLERSNSIEVRPMLARPVLLSDLIS